MEFQAFACGCELYSDSFGRLDLCPCSGHARDYVEEYWCEGDKNETTGSSDLIQLMSLGPQ